MPRHFSGFLVGFPEGFGKTLVSSLGVYGIAAVQVAAYELAKVLPEGLQPLPLELIRIGDTDTAISPNGGADTSPWDAAC